MKVLLDTNIVIERESNSINETDIGNLYYWLDKLTYAKCVHKTTLEEIERHKDKKVRETMKIKLQSYNILTTEASLNPAVEAVSKKFDVSSNDFTDTKILNELFNNKVDILITEDGKIHKKAEALGVAHRVFRIETFLEKVNAENPQLVEYRNPIAKKKKLGNIPLQDQFFDSFRRDYPGFDGWYNSKSEEPAYVCLSPEGQVLAFLYIKKEDENEDYYSEGKRIEPVFSKKKRLKIGTFKVSLNGYKLGERFLKIIFDNALKQKVDQIYVTIFDNEKEKIRLIELLKEWGFKEWGIKTSKAGLEKVYVRDFARIFNSEEPKFSFPYIAKDSKIHFVLVNPEYHTELFPDSILKTEDPENFIGNKASMNAISKIFVSHTPNRDIKKGDSLLFYRTKDNGPAAYTSVVTTLGIVESINNDIKTEEEFISLCGKRSVFDKEDLGLLWNKYSSFKPFIVNFLYAYSFPKRANLQKLIDMKVVRNVMSVPRPFEIIDQESFSKIVEATETDRTILV